RGGDLQARGATQCEPHRARPQPPQRRPASQRGGRPPHPVRGAGGADAGHPPAGPPRPRPRPEPLDLPTPRPSGVRGRMNWVDLVIIAVVAWTAFNGIRTGLIRQVVWLVAI